MNVEIGTEAAQIPEKESINWDFVAVHRTISNTSIKIQYTVYVYKSGIENLDQHRAAALHGIAFKPAGNPFPQKYPREVSPSDTLHIT